MKIKREKISLREEQNIITNMITSTEFMKRTNGKIKSHLFESPYTRIVAGWVNEYYEHTGEAPGIDIQDLYKRKQKEVEDEEEVELVKEFLQKLSDNWKSSQAHNIAYEVKNAVAYMNIQQMKVVRQQLDDAIAAGNVEQGHHAIGKFTEIRESTSSGVNIFKDAGKIREAFNEEVNTLFGLQGALGKILPPLTRGDFLAILGGQKSTKSWCMQYIQRRATSLGFSVFKANIEMDAAEQTQREWQNYQGQPEQPRKVELPYFAEEDDGFYIDYRTEKKEGVNLVDIEKIQKQYRMQMGGDSYTYTYTSNVTTLSEIITDIDNLETYNNFRPDVIIVDYADIIKSEVKGEPRFQLDDIWKRLRGLAQEKNCAVVTASQVNASAWGKDIKASDVDENKKKGAHVTKMIALNTTDDEMEKGMIRVKTLYQRKGYRTTKQAVVLHGLDIGRWYLDSIMQEDLIDEE